MKLIDRFNQYINDTCAASPWGSFISMEDVEATTIRAVIYAFARNYNLKESIPVEELQNLADQIEKQGKELNEKFEVGMEQYVDQKGAIE